MNAFLKWCGEALIQKLKEPCKISPTYSPADVEKILKGKMCRSKLLILLLMDAGLRIDEALGLRVREIDFENLVLRIGGFGDSLRGAGGEWGY